MPVEGPDDAEMAEDGDGGIGEEEKAGECVGASRWSW